MKERLKVSIERYFRPEFLNRLDDVIVFHSLNKENLKQIVDIELSKVRNRLADRGLELVLTDEAKEFIIAKGFNPDYGARPLRRAIENLIEDPLSEEILRGSFKGMDRITVLTEGADDTKRLKFDATSKDGSKAALAGVGGGQAGSPGEAKSS
jgi:ATP-dependent Clp protease ATP-binding subunit ClpC